jgi:hypothetical protein
MFLLSQHNQLIASSNLLLLYKQHLAISSLRNMFLLSQHNQLIARSYLLLLSKQDLSISRISHCSPCPSIASLLPAAICSSCTSRT